MYSFFTKTRLVRLQKLNFVFEKSKFRFFEHFRSFTSFIEGSKKDSLKSHSMLAGRYNDIKKYLAIGKMPSNLPSTTSNFQREANRYTLEANGELSRQGKRVALYADRMKIFNAFHQGSHQGRDGSWKKIKARYYWRGGQAFVAKKVNECVACAHKNNQLWKACLPKLKAIPVKPKAFWRGITF